ncbi:type III secretion system outer membrane ring subunit SctC [Stenotrophomonas sp. B1-1]|uniref:type III secretion system outer membrane ring subunit SctC n=1 Tax=Stenotrophomonas sp. B1-1 TaxID=2710648 RepID=UPI0013DA65BF|nr:type III secretion system outer membrane ring subunit SctC [Stenotrophomonas sp. B1-1]
MNKFKNPVRGALLALVLTTPAASLQAQDVPLQGTTIQNPQDLPHAEGFVSRNESVEQLAASLANGMRQSAIVSAKAKRRRVSGSFDLANPRRVLDQVSDQIGLVWYSDGRFLYIYEAAEATSAVGHLRYANVTSLFDFLEKTRLADKRYAVRGGTEGTFYVSGPPVYVDIVMKAARYLDALYEGSDQQATHVEVIKLQNSFVNGRRYVQRDREIELPGVADALRAVFGTIGAQGIHVVSSLGAAAGGPDDGATDGALAAAAPDVAASPKAGIPSADGLPGPGPALVVAYVETNSLLIRGTREQIRQIKALVNEIDQPRAQVELAVWIIDIKKTQLEQLGVRWSGQVGIAGRLGVSFNEGSVSTLDGQRFLASINALAENGDAWITSRPALLTQENTEARFDSSQSFYASLVGERSSALEQVTYGTAINVLPRISRDEQVEMQLQIEDGSASGSDNYVDGLPTVSRTRIDTVARVPHGLSLLVGGYSRSSSEFYRHGVPGLKRIPYVGGLFRGREKRDDSIARLYLVQPRVLGDRDAATGDRLRQQMGMDLDARIEQAAEALRSGGMQP